MIESMDDFGCFAKAVLPMLTACCMSGPTKTRTTRSTLQVLSLDNYPAFDLDKADVAYNLPSAMLCVQSDAELSHVLCTSPVLGFLNLSSSVYVGDRTKRKLESLFRIKKKTFSPKNKSQFCRDSRLSRNFL